MTRVGFVLAYLGPNWIGGVNYYRNLFKAIVSLPNKKICPVIFVGDKTNLDFLAGYPEIEIVYSSLFDRFSLLWCINRVLSIFGKEDYLLTQLLMRNEIEILSHASKGNRKIKTIGWIADFQHLHLPVFFTPKERQIRDEQIMEMAKGCTCIVVSSNDALKDFVSLAPAFVNKSKVLRFVSIPARSEATPLDVLQKKYQFNKPYFYIPNQFWAHKNHKVVIDALDLLKNTHPDVLVLSSGATNDYRNPRYFPEMMEKLEANGTIENFRVLGIIPYNDVVGLMLNSLSVINPSMFEGWSTTVEEAKSLGVPLLLSDISVHIEQATGIASFFSTQNPIDLAEKMLNSIEGVGKPQLIDESNSSQSDQIRLAEFGEAYQQMVIELVNATKQKV